MSNARSAERCGRMAGVRLEVARPGREMPVISAIELEAANARKSTAAVGSEKTAEPCWWYWAAAFVRAVAVLAAVGPFECWFCSLVLSAAAMTERQNELFGSVLGDVPRVTKFRLIADLLVVFDPEFELGFVTRGRVTTFLGLATFGRVLLGVVTRGFVTVGVGCRGAWFGDKRSSRRRRCSGRRRSTDLRVRLRALALVAVLVRVVLDERRVRFDLWSLSVASHVRRNVRAVSATVSLV